jgi:hypothetical protein
MSWLTHRMICTASIPGFLCLGRNLKSVLRYKEANRVNAHSLPRRWTWGRRSADGDDSRLASHQGWKDLGHTFPYVDLANKEAAEQETLSKRHGHISNFKSLAELMMLSVCFVVF